MVHRQLFRLSVIKMQINSSVSFLQKRWQEQTETKKAAVKQIFHIIHRQQRSAWWAVQYLVLRSLHDNKPLRYYITGEQSSIFTGIFYDHYSAPIGFCFDVVCRDEPFIDNPRSADYNVVKKVSERKQQFNDFNYTVTNCNSIRLGEGFRSAHQSEGS